ncbi:MAG: CDP-glycerol glycerophosphotransferase family protein [Candidatus Bipolaricaulota bacterium]
MWREIEDFCRFFWRTPTVEKTIVFYAEHAGYYPYFEGLVEELIGEHKQSLCYVTSDPNDPILQTSESRIRAFYVSKLLPIFMAYINSKVFVMTLTDLNRFYLKRSINPVHYVYVFHALVSTHMAYLYGAFDHYDSILCVGPHQIEEIRRHEELNKLPPKRLVEAGYYRLERIYKAYQEYSPGKPSSSTKGIILIAPSWGADNVLESCGEHLVAILLEAGYEVIVRPHPETVRRSPNLLELFASRFGSNASFTLERSVADDDSLLRANVLICDCSGVALEYSFGTERPVLFLDVPIKIRNPRFEELGTTPLELSLRLEIGVIVSPEKLDTVPEVISNLITNSATYRKRIAELREQNVYAFGRSSEIGAQCIIELAAATDRR